MDPANHIDHPSQTSNNRKCNIILLSNHLSSKNDYRSSAFKGCSYSIQKPKWTLLNNETMSNKWGQTIC